MEQERPDPEALLRQITAQEAHDATTGTLKIFFGYAAGVGKTYAMLEAAHSVKKTGVDVVVGYVEPHMRPDTQALLDGLEALPTLPIHYRGAVLREFDLDAAIRRKPQLILVDEMAHTNATGCRHLKRYQDIQELLRHGIDVSTTVNVQHVESLNDVVESITGITVRERVPDKVFDSADHVELVDIEPGELLARLEQGKIYKQDQARRAMGHFFAVENLVALREIALRRTADIVGKTVEKNKTLQRRTDYFTNEHLLVCLSSSPANAKVIRTAARMAEAFHGKLTALFVETSTPMTPDNRARLDTHAHLAKELGGSLASVEGDDVPWHVTEFAKASGVSKIVIGRPVLTGRFWPFRKPNFIDQLTALAPNLDIYVIPNQLRQTDTSFQPARRRLPAPHLSWQDLLKGIGFLTASTVIGFGFYSLNLNEGNIIMAYMVGVLFASLSINGLFPSMLYALCSVLAFNFFFTEPRFSLNAYDPAHPVTFGTMLLVSGIISTLAKRLQQQKGLAAQKAYRTALLLETSQKLQGARDAHQIIYETGRQLMYLLSKSVMMYPTREGRLGTPLVMEHPSQPDAAAKYTNRQERAVAEWTLYNCKQAGAGTNTLPGARTLCLCIRGQEEALGVVAIAVDGTPLDAFEKGLLVAVLGECSLALEKERIRESKDMVFMQARQESLRANMLRAISHDLRTPLTSISGNAHILRSNASTLTEETRQRLYTDMYDDAAWLISLVENILSVTRLEDGSVKLRMEPELVADCIHEALRHVNRQRDEHHLEVRIEDDLLMARMDVHLIMQVIVNMVDNAIKYTPEGSIITITAIRKKAEVAISVGDNGEGIPDEVKERLFDMFFTVNQTAPDSRRGLGLGLFLCKSIIMAHGGHIRIENNMPQGSLFTFTLPA